jgi:hypothetical protein
MPADEPTLYARFASSSFADPDGDAGLDAPPGHDGPVPLGLGLVTWLQGSLAGTDKVIENQWITPSGHAFDVASLGHRFDVVVQHAPDLGEAEWLLSVEPRRGLMPWKRPNTTGLDGVALALHQVLRPDPRVEALRWYTAAQWGHRDPGPGQPEPPR